jgi:hypothetical protein
MTSMKSWTLLDPEGKTYQSEVPGNFGGHKPGKIYGLLNCRSALKAIERGGYIKNRVFFMNEDTAIAAGYRPCGVCMPSQYTRWKSESNQR